MHTFDLQNWLVLLNHHLGCRNGICHSIWAKGEQVPAEKPATAMLLLKCYHCNVYSISVKLDMYVTGIICNFKNG